MMSVTNPRVRIGKIHGTDLHTGKPCFIECSVVDENVTLSSIGSKGMITLPYKTFAEFIRSFLKASEG